MKRAKKFIAVLTTISIMLTTVLTASAADLKTSNVATTTQNSLVTYQYPQVDGMADLNKKIVADINAFYDKFYNEFFDPTQGITIKTTITNDSDALAKLEMVIGLYTDVAGTNSVTKTYFIDKANSKELADEAAYKAAIAAEEEAATEEATTEEATTEEETEATETTEEVTLTADDLLTMVGLRASLVDLTNDVEFSYEFDASVGMVSVFFGSDVVAYIFIGQDLYIIDEESYELGAEAVIKDGYTQVPLDFIVHLATALEADVLLDDLSVVGLEFNAAATVADDAEVEE